MSRLLSFTTHVVLPKPYGSTDVRVYTDYSRVHKMYAVYMYDGKHKRMQVGKTMYQSQDGAIDALNVLAERIENKHKENKIWTSIKSASS